MILARQAEKINAQFLMEVFALEQLGDHVFSQSYLKYYHKSSYTRMQADPFIRKMNIY